MFRLPLLFCCYIVCASQLHGAIQTKIVEYRDCVVSLHSGLDSLRPEEAKKIKAKVLICRGADAR